VFLAGRQHSHPIDRLRNRDTHPGETRYRVDPFGSSCPRPPHPPLHVVPNAEGPSGLSRSRS